MDRSCTRSSQMASACQLLGKFVYPGFPAALVAPSPHAGGRGATHPRFCRSGRMGQHKARLGEGKPDKCSQQHNCSVGHTPCRRIQQISYSVQDWRWSDKKYRWWFVESLSTRPGIPGRNSVWLRQWHIRGLVSSSGTWHLSGADLLGLQFVWRIQGSTKRMVHCWWVVKWPQKYMPYETLPFIVKTAEYIGHVSRTCQSIIAKHIWNSLECFRQKFEIIFKVEFKPYQEWDVEFNFAGKQLGFVVIIVSSLSNQSNYSANWFSAHIYATREE